MIKKIVFTVVLFTLLLTPLSKVVAQSDNISITETKDLSFDSSTVPQWAKDLRRFDIITFGTFPFSMLFTTLIYDFYLRNNEMGMTGNYYGNVMLMSAGVSFTLALTDIIITIVKRNKEKRRLESIPSGNYEIETLPYGEQDPDPGESPPGTGS